MLDETVEYLKNLHGLEIAAGINFRLVWGDLQQRGLLTAELGRDLIEAHSQEMGHARCIRRMIKLLVPDFVLTKELMKQPQEILEGLRTTTAVWPHELDAYAMIAFNHEFERRFAAGGVEEFYRNMYRVGAVLGNHEFSHTAWRFYTTVLDEERWHVEVDLAVMGLYQEIHDGFDMAGLLASVQVPRSPVLRQIIRAKQAFVRAVAA